ncbi:MAG: hypothetical protein WCP65_00125 [Bacteroidota bacterium]|tara:strand:+ start:4521 stop:5024 length:504 start_codon:yes stop_codon:yes gene_type:complete
MKFAFKTIDNVKAAQFFLEDPLLCFMALGDEALKDFDNNRGYNPAPCTITGIYHKNKLICIVQATLFTESTVSLHLYLKSNLHHSGILKPLHIEYGKYLQKYYPNLKKVMIISPTPCKHVHDAIKGLGFKQEGCLTKSMIWRGQLVDLLIFGRELLPKVENKLLIGN